MNSILVGCDPEVFVKQKGTFLSAFGLIKGDKANPFPVDKGAVQVDGMALEFNISPASTQQEFLLNVQSVYDTLKAMVPDYDVVAVPVADFTPAYMKAQPAEALELGCDPDFSGWTMSVNQKPNGNRPFRTASGHVHIGWTNNQEIYPGSEHYDQCGAVAREMDFYLGLPSLAYDKDVRRRELYGNPACFRPKSYGVEYRTLSNAWLNSDETIEWVFRAVKHGMEQFFNGVSLVEKYGDIQHIIKTSDWKAAKKIIDAELIEVPYV